MKKIKTFLTGIALLVGISTMVAQEQSEKPTAKIGGAVRYNYIYKDWSQASKNNAGDLGQDIFRLNVEGNYKQLYMNAEYRFFTKAAGGGILKKGYMGYKFNENHNLQFGLTGAPFGLLPYTSNDFYFAMNYFIGLEDDDDLGVKYIYTNGPWNVQAAYFKNSDLFGGSGPAPLNRYSLDLVGKVKEVDQFNGRVTYTYGETFKQEFGLSAMLGRSYDIDTEKYGKRQAFAAHYQADYSNFNLKLEYLRYDYEHPDGKTPYFTVGAFNGKYNVANKGQTFTCSAAYKLEVNKGVLDYFLFYNDFSMLKKDDIELANQTLVCNDSFIETLGCGISAGPVYIYVDNIWGKNMPWLGGTENGFVQGKNLTPEEQDLNQNEEWHYRFNVNVGYYF